MIQYSREEGGRRKDENSIMFRSDFARTYRVIHSQPLIDIAVAAMDMSACCLPVI